MSRQRCVCGALEGEPCRSHDDVIAYQFINGKLTSISRNRDGDLWREGDPLDGLPPEVMLGLMEAHATMPPRPW